MSEAEHISMFACSCGDENKAKMAALRALSVERKQVFDRPGFYATAALHWLADAYDLHVTRIDLDQWGAVTIESDAPTDTDPIILYIQFDVFEDALAMALDVCYERWGAMRHPEDEP